MGFLGDPVVKNLPAKQETAVASLAWEEPLEKKNGNPFQYSCLRNPMDKGAWQPMRSQKSQTQHSDYKTTKAIPISPLFLGFTSCLGHHRTESSSLCYKIGYYLSIYVCAHGKSLQSCLTL